MGISRAIQFRPGLYIAWILLIIAILIMTFMAFRFPQTFKLIESHAQKNRYERTRLNDKNIQKYVERLETLMQDELFRNPDLNLAVLGQKMNLSPPQVSEFLNLHMGISFASYINSQRVEYAKKRLGETDDSITEIAFDSGFNSKSAFHAAFHKETQQSPSQFRKAQKHQKQ